MQLAEGFVDVVADVPGRPGRVCGDVRLVIGRVGVLRGRGARVGSGTALPLTARRAHPTRP